MFGTKHNLDEKILWVFVLSLAFVITSSSLILSLCLSITLAALAVSVLALIVLIWLVAFISGTEFPVVISGLKPIAIAL
uniref:Uncharacterized protein n=1 Tax=Kalanchoe fedtschenkoi TaxID=63787 RepID=A0A7N0VAS1_KALFE